MDVRTYITVLTTLLGLNSFAANLIGDERHYMAIFGSQTEPNLPRNSHTYAVFMRVTDNGSSEEKKPQVESFCISWMPRTLNIVTLRRFPEVGINLTLEDTNRWARSIGANIRMWGPYPVRKELYQMAQQQHARLVQSAMLYVCLDGAFRGAIASNCIHAVSDLDVTQPPLQTGTLRGQGASAAVVQHFQRYILPTTEDTSYLASHLGINPNNAQAVTQPVIRPVVEQPVVYGYQGFSQGIAWPTATP